MKIIFTLISVIVLSFILWHEQLLNSLGNSEFKYKWLLFLKSDQFETVIKAADKTPYSGIRLCPDCIVLPDSEHTYSAWVKQGNTHENVKHPELKEFIEVAKLVHLETVDIRRYDGGWFIYASPDWPVNGNSIHAWMYFGLPPNNDNCDTLLEGISEKGQCHTHLFGNWYFNKFWSIDND